LENDPPKSKPALIKFGLSLIKDFKISLVTIGITLFLNINIFFAQNNTVVIGKTGANSILTFNEKDNSAYVAGLLIFFSVSIVLIVIYLQIQNKLKKNEK